MGKAVSDRQKNRSHNTHICAHTGHENDGPAALRDHVASGFTRREEGTVNIDIVQALYTIKGVTEGHQYLGFVPSHKTLTRKQSSSQQYLEDVCQHQR